MPSVIQSSKPKTQPVQLNTKAMQQIYFFLRIVWWVKSALLLLLHIHCDLSSHIPLRGMWSAGVFSCSHAAFKAAQWRKL